MVARNAAGSVRSVMTSLTLASGIRARRDCPSIWWATRMQGISWRGWWMPRSRGATPHSTASADCPVLDPSTQGLEPGVDSACLTRIERTLVWLEAQPPGAVVFANSYQYWTSPDGPGRAAGGTETPSSSAGITPMGRHSRRPLRDSRLRGMRSSSCGRFPSSQVTTLECCRVHTLRSPQP